MLPFIMPIIFALNFKRHLHLLVDKGPGCFRTVLNKSNMLMLEKDLEDPGPKHLPRLLRVYSRQGALQAYDSLMPLLNDQSNKYISTNEFFALKELQFVLVDELGGNTSDINSTRLDASPKFSSSEFSVQAQKQMTSIKGLADVVHVWAQTIRFRTNDPVQSKAFARQLVNYSNMFPDSPIPANWIAGAKLVIEECEKRRLKQSENIASKNASPWKHHAREYSENAPVLKDLFDMIGLHQVKSEFVRLYHRSELSKMQGDAHFSYNAVFEGNPGTGKSSVAAIYTTFLKQLGVLPERAAFIEATGASLMDEDDKTGFKAQLASLKAARGGVLFVEDAHELLPERAGRPIWRSILQLASSLSADAGQGRVVVCVAGQAKDLDTLFGHRPGSRGRFPVRLLFDDFSDDELLALFMRKLRLQPAPGQPAQNRSRLHCADAKYAMMAARRLGRQRGRPGFDNARAVEALVGAARLRQADRIRAEQRAGRRPGIFVLTRADVLGPRVTEAGLKSSAAYRALQALEGLEAVKRSVDALIGLAVANGRRERAGQPPLEVVLNRVFVGNPGTGKTTVARIYGRLLAELGLLSKGDVLLRTASDFMGDVVGSSERKTREQLAAAEGCVLVIDEAYSLYSGGGGGGGLGGGTGLYGEAVIATLVEQVQATPGDDRAVILLGYREEMARMMRGANPGLARRFQLEHAFDFPDYTDEQVLRTLLAKARAADDDIFIMILLSLFCYYYFNPRLHGRAAAPHPAGQGPGRRPAPGPGRGAAGGGAAGRGPRPAQLWQRRGGGEPAVGGEAAAARGRGRGAGPAGLRHRRRGGGAGGRGRGGGDAGGPGGVRPGDCHHHYHQHHCHR